MKTKDGKEKMKEEVKKNGRRRQGNEGERKRRKMKRTKRVKQKEEEKKYWGRKLKKKWKSKETVGIE